jgi:hypothetical protein
MRATRPILFDLNILLTLTLASGTNYEFPRYVIASFNPPTGPLQQPDRVNDGLRDCSRRQ